MHYFFLEADFEDLNQEIATVCDRIKDAGREIGRSYNEGHETSHDNFAYEQGQRDQEMWSNRVRQLVRVRNNVQIAVPGPNRGQVRIGRLVTVRDLSSGKEKVFRVGSYMIFRETGEDGIQILSYDAPLPKALIGTKEGDEREMFFGGQKHRFEVIKIE